jgi:hypothetical protein
MVNFFNKGPDRKKKEKILKCIYLSLHRETWKNKPIKNKVGYVWWVLGGK